MIKLRLIPILLSLILFSVNSTSGYELVSELRSMGYAIIPAPQKVTLNGEHVVIDNSWKIVSEIADGHIVLNRLTKGALSLHGLTFSNSGPKQIILKINSKAVNGISNKACNEQAYKLSITADKIVIEGNAEAGLFYGVQSFLQLLKSNNNGKYKLPQGTIIDWPRLELRFIHWDSKHNRGRIKDLKRYIDWAAHFKVNAIAFEIEDKYEYPSHPVIGGPNALSKAEMVELTKYARERFIQLVPNIQSPAHMAYVLKHEEFAHLRADGSNYQICLCDEEAIKLIQDMYQDIMDATPGIDLFVSTDELYYPGVCGKFSNPYTKENKSQYWADYVKTIHKWLNGRRRMLVWMEFPLLAKDIAQFPNDIINGVTYPNRDQEFVDIEYEKGISQLSYSSLQGEEWLFPNYFPGKYRGKNINGRLNDVSDDIKGLLKIKNHLMGNFAAAWDDSGLHNETFWLGWISASQYAWNPHGPTVEQITADFMDIFYGTNAQSMVENYKLLQLGARFYQSSWELKDALNLPMIYGRHDSIYQFPRKRPAMSAPGLPLIENEII
ncbi:MAG: beta-N-acetylhexosaminidase [Cyclobacteriaceae bacterium]|nr:beta-N-acetylhexosaminidase [Cyclobacteriaceae bacterium]